MDLDFLTHTPFWIALGQIIIIDILLGGDNAVVIALACRKLPAAQRSKGIIWGTAGAIVLRVVLIFFAMSLLALPYREQLAQKQARLQELLGDRSIDEGRLVTEAAIFADKTAIDEETVRLHSHVAQYREILELDEPIGRKLDFLTQELNRESNTIGSKCQDVAITRLVVDLKSEIEKIREQIQNIE